MRRILLLAASGAVLMSAACQDTKIEDPLAIAPAPMAAAPAKAEPATEKAGPPTLQEAKEFLETSAKEIVELNEYALRVYWVNANFLTEDTDWLVAKVGAEGSKLSTRLANNAKRYNELSLPADMQRKMDSLKRGSDFPAPE